MMIFLRSLIAASWMMKPVLADFKQIPGQEFYIAKERRGAPVKFMTRSARKYPTKFLVWQAICTCGKKSEAFITSGTLNTDLYVEKCLNKRILPFIQSHNIPVFFWPDLATIHYEKRV